MKRVLALVLAALALLATTGAAGAARPTSGIEEPRLPALPPLHGVPIPSLPTDLLAERFTGEPATPQPIEHRRVPKHPWLAPNGSSSMHNDPYSTDAYEQPGPLGKDLQVSSASYGVRECATIAFDSHGRIEALCGGLEGFAMMLIDPVTLQPLAQLSMPGRTVTGLPEVFTDICGGTYFFLTDDDRAFATTTTSQIWEIEQTSAPTGLLGLGGGPGLTKARSWDIAPHLPAGDCLIALTADWAGNIWFFSQGGVAGVLDPGTGSVRTVRMGSGEQNFNSVSVDETGGVYAVTTHALYRLDLGADGRPEITWREPYDRGSTKKPGMLSQGSGTSPTLVGERWIVIGDNAEPRMNILVLDRRRGVEGDRLHCSVPVFEAGASTTENSLVAAGSSVLVENNYGYAGIGSTMLGRTTTGGIARVMIGPDGCHVAWTNDEVVAPTSVPKASLANGLLYVYTKPARSDGIDEWRFTAVDIRTGEVAWSRLTGTGVQWNNHYAAVYLGPDGAAYISTVAGLVRLEDG